MKKCGFKMLKGAHVPDTCQEKADTLVYDRRIGKVKEHCRQHAYQVADLTSPEHIGKCAHCGCLNPEG